MVRVEFGKARCRFHGGLSTGPKSEAGRARIAEAQRRRCVRIENGRWMTSKQSEEHLWMGRRDLRRMNAGSFILPERGRSTVFIPRKPVSLAASPASAIIEASLGEGRPALRREHKR